MNMGYHSNLQDICKNMALFIFTLDVLQFYYQWREVLSGNVPSSHSAKHQSPILCTVSPVSQNLNEESLNHFHIKYASFGRGACCRNTYGKLSHLRENYGKSSQKFCRFSLRGNPNFHLMFWFGSYISAQWKLQDGTFLMICTLYWYIAVLSC